MPFQMNEGDLSPDSLSGSLEQPDIVTMFFSLSVYIGLAFILFIFALDEMNKSKLRIYRLHNVKRTFVTFNILAICMLFALVVGIRYNVGVDNVSYIEAYKYYQDTGKLSRSDLEPLFLGVRSLFANSGLHYSFFNGFWGLIEILFILLALRKERYLYPVTVVYVILGPIFTHWTNGVRQCVATCIFIFLIQYIADKKFIKYLIGILICSLIHKSALILLPLYFIFLKTPKFNNKGWLLSVILILCAVLGSVPVWVSSLNGISNYLEILGYEQYENFFDNISLSETENMSWGPGRIGLFFSSLISVYLFPKIKNRFDLDKRFDIYFALFFTGCCLFNLLANTSHILLRPVYYLYDLRIIIIPATIYYLYKLKKYPIFLIACILAYFNNPYLTFRAYQQGDNEKSPEVYKTLFTEDKDFNKL